MTALNKQALRDSALDMIRVLGYIASFESEDIDGDDLELRFETEDGFDTGCTISITSQCQDASDVMQQLLNELEAAERRIAEHNFENRLLANADRDIKALRQRIAELEARTVTLPTPYPKGYGLVSDKYNFALEECADAIRAAGIGVKGE
ncbi:ead/Ea22-like family protein [Citrobacter braakii]|uniref:ead/Ea22-like family protein n=1 Tax=Citrobacter braakii TaxID=57706 RepID=UPI0037CBB8E8